MAAATSTFVGEQTSRALHLESAAESPDSEEPLLQASQTQGFAAAQHAAEPNTRRRAVLAFAAFGAVATFAGGVSRLGALSFHGGVRGSYPRSTAPQALRPGGLLTEWGISLPWSRPAPEPAPTPAPSPYGYYYGPTTVDEGYSGQPPAPAGEAEPEPEQPEPEKPEPEEPTSFTVEPYSGPTRYTGGDSEQDVGDTGNDQNHWNPVDQGHDRHETGGEVMDPQNMQDTPARDTPPIPEGEEPQGDEEPEQISTTTPISSNLLYCFALMMADGYEKDLIRAALAKGVSIFACDGWDVFSSDKVQLSKGPPTPLYAKSIGSMKCEFGGPYKLALNTDVFVKAWKRIFLEQTFMYFAWTIKADPDCVFMPRVFKTQVRDVNPNMPFYYNNCDDGLHGPIEVIARGGMMRLKDSLSVCLMNKTLQEEKSKWGEDVFLRHCFQLLNVTKVDYYDLLTEKACFHKDPQKDGCVSGDAAYHPFKDVDGYFRCLHQAEEAKPKLPDKPPAPPAHSEK
mmetsp:Transcript_42355/g.123013  ORF Transcript_42355/g.123013 Transcript_42355/m.123013 type:complete len:510 (+) Transcript_42355:75-1604(+)